MAGNGGKREGAGRKPGATNKKTAEAIEAARSTGIMPLDFMLDLMRAPIPENASRIVKASLKALRFEAAKAAAPYLHPKLANIEVGNKKGESFKVVVQATDGDL